MLFPLHTHKDTDYCVWKRHTDCDSWILIVDCLTVPRHGWIQILGFNQSKNFQSPYFPRLTSWYIWIVGKHALRYQLFMAPDKPCTTCHIWQNHIYNHNKISRGESNTGSQRALTLLLNEKANLSFLSSCESSTAFTNKQPFSHGTGMGLHPIQPLSP